MQTSQHETRAHEIGEGYGVSTKCLLIEDLRIQIQNTLLILRENRVSQQHCPAQIKLNNRIE